MEEPGNKYGQQFVEANAILAAQEGDEEELERLLDTMSMYELSELRDAANHLAYEASRMAVLKAPLYKGRDRGETS